MADFPAELSTGMVHGRFIVAVIDSEDEGQDPDVVPAQGKVAFKASVGYIPVPVATGGPVTVMKGPIMGVLDSEGYLCTPYPATDEPMYRGVRLVSTDDPDMAVTDWTWSADYRLEAVNGSSMQIPAHSFALPSGSEVDLTTLVKVPSSPGYGLPQAEAAVLRAEAAAGTVADARILMERAEDAADRAEAPTDLMNKNLIENSASLTAGALSTAIVGQAGVRLWKPMTNYYENTRVIMPSGDVKVARTWVAGSAEPNLSQWLDMPQVARERVRARAESVRGIPSRVDEVAIPDAFLAKWNPGIKVFKGSNGYSTNWTAAQERNTGGRNVYFAAAAAGVGNGGVYGSLATPITPYATITTLSVSPLIGTLPVGTLLAVIHDGKLLTETMLVVAVQANSGSTSVTVEPATAPATGLPAGADVVRPIGIHLGNALGQVSNGDTIVILDKHLHRSNIFVNPITRSVNIESIHEQTTIANSEDVAWTPLASNTFVSATNPIILTVVDMSISADGYEYERKETAAEVTGNPGTWHQAYDASGPITVCPTTPGVPDNTSLLLLSESQSMTVNGIATDMRVYVKGIRFIGGSEGIKVSNPNASVLTFVQDGCQFLWGGYGYRGAGGSNEANTALRISGNVVSLAYNSPVSHSSGDGRGYSGIDTYKPRGLEVNCGGHSAGRTRAAGRLGITTIQNVSTMHDGGAVLRIGGDYSGSYGAVIADVHEGTVSLNYGVDAHDSTATGGYNNAFAAQQAGTEMWVIGCRAWGCTADILSVAGATVRVVDTEFDTRSGSAYMEIVNPL